MKKKLNRVWRQATADKKKFGILVTMMAVGLLLWGRLMLLQDVPKMATADDPNAVQSGDPASGHLAETAAETMPALPPLPSVEVALSEDLTLDLFSFRHNHYKPLPIEDSPETRVQSTGDPDDDRKRELVEMARSLRLQSVIQGNSPAIVINGEVLRVGDEIEHFKIVSFNDNSVRLTREGLTFLLKMFTK